MRKSKFTLVIMAAGMGSRYGGLKQIEPVGPNGEIIIDYSIFDALRSGFGKIVFVIKRAIENDFLEIIGKRVSKYCETAFVFQELNTLPAGYLVPTGRSKPWGTGHATLTCKDVIDGPFVVINADDFYGVSSFSSAAKYLSTIRNADAISNYCMVGYQLKNTITEHGHVARGVCRLNSDSNLLGVHEYTRIQKFGKTAKYTKDEGETWVELPLNTTVSMNLWGFTPRIFQQLDESFSQFITQSSDLQNDEIFLPDVVNTLLETKQALVKVLPTKERWVGVTYREDKLVVEQYIQGLVSAGYYPNNLWEY